MLQTLQTLLARYAIPQAMAACSAAHKEVAVLEQQLARVEGRIPWWERAAFFHESNDEKLAASLKDQLEAARGRCDGLMQRANQLFAGAYAESPPLEIAQRVERVIAAAQEDAGLGRRVSKEEPLASELEALAARVTALWVPGFDLTWVRNTLSQDAALEQLAAQVQAGPRTDQRLWWAPISLAEAAARAAAALRTPAFQKAKAWSWKEAQDCVVAAGQLQQAEQQVSTLQRLTPGKGDSEVVVEALQDVLAREKVEALIASEYLRYTIETALAAFPVLGIYFSALAAASVIRVAVPTSEDCLTAEGTLSPQPDYAARALILSVLASLRRAVETAFPGLPALLVSRATAAPSQGVSPYRGVVQTVAQRVPRESLQTVVNQVLGHATMLGTLALAQANPGAVPEGAAREQVHRSQIVLLLRSLRTEADRLLQGSPAHDLGAATIAAHRHARSIATNEAYSSSPIACVPFHKKELVGALGEIEVVLQRAFGLALSRAALAEAIEKHLQGASVPSPLVRGAPFRVLSQAETIVAFAEALRPTEFRRVRQHTAELQQRLSQTLKSLSAARANVGTWDKLNVFSKSEAEKERDRLEKESSELFSAVARTQSKAEELLDGALGIYGPAAVFFGFPPVLEAADKIKATSQCSTSTRTVNGVTITSKTYSCRLEGREGAIYSLQHWTQRMLALLGPPRTASLLLEEWASQQLQ